MRSIALITGLMLLGFVTGWRFQAPALLLASFFVAVFIGTVVMIEGWPLHLALLAGLGSLSILQASYLFSLIVRTRYRTICAKKID